MRMMKSERMLVKPMLAKAGYRFTTLAICLLVAALLVSCAGGSEGSNVLADTWQKLFVPGESSISTSPSNSVAGTLVASGFIEGEEVTIAPEVGGHLVELLVARGDEVSAGDVLVRLDDISFQSQRAEAEAGLATANADLNRVLAAARPGEIAGARAALVEARAMRDGMENVVLNVQDVISQPLALNTEIDEARAQAYLAEQEVEMAEADLEATKLRHNVYSDRGGDVKRIWDLQLQVSQAELTRTEIKLDGAWAYLRALLAIRDNPLALKAELHQAETAVRLADTQIAAAQARLDELEAGATAEEIAVAEAQVRFAEAALHLIDAQAAQLTLHAPISGIVSSRMTQIGETVTAGKPLLALADINEVNLVLYIPESRIAEVQVGQVVEVQVDSFPDRRFTGHVLSVAGEAEFTPRNVQTQEERVNLVFAVKVRLPNPQRVLKAGMPADAAF
jgi:HlyD family secretion protein